MVEHKLPKLDTGVRFPSPALLVICVLAALSPQAFGQKPRLPPNSLAADMVYLKGGPRLYGVLVKRDEVGNVTLAINDSWLKNTYPEYHKIVQSRERDYAGSVSSRLVKRIKAWKARRADDVGIQVFLEKELKRLDDAGKKPAGGDPARKGPAAEKTSPPMLFVEVLADEIRTAYAQTPQRRKLMWAALQHEVKNAVGRSPSAILRELEQLDVDWRNVSPPTATPKQAEDSDRQWAARVALVEYRFRKPLKFQGAGSFLARTGAGADKLGLDKVMSEVLKDQLTAQLEELLGGPAKKDDGKWLEQAIREAEKEKVLGFRVARLKKDLARGSATVEILFYAKMPDGEWEQVHRSQSSRSADSVKAESLEEVAGADDVKKIMTLLKGAGGLAGEGAIRRALGFGAATKEAMNDAHVRFTTFLTPYTKRLDQPAIAIRP